MANYDIFISYRREGGRDYARNVQLALQAKGYKNVFFDFNSLRNGVFNEKIIDAINNCKDFILILSENSMDRCTYEDDWVAREILTAIAAGCNIIPLAVGKFKDFPDNFPKDLGILRLIQRSQLMTDEFFYDSIDHLIERLDSVPLTQATEKNNHQVGAEIHLYADADCKILDYGTVIKDLVKANEDTVVFLKKGLHNLTFISIEEPSISSDLEYKVVNDIDKLSIALQAHITCLVNKKEREKQWAKKQEENRKKEEEKLRKQKEQEETEERLKASLPPTITFKVDGHDIVFLLNKEKTHYTKKRMGLMEMFKEGAKDLIPNDIKSEVQDLGTLFLSKSIYVSKKLYQFVKKPWDEIELGEKIKSAIESEGCTVVLKEDEFSIYVFSKWRNFEYFKAKYLGSVS